MYSKFIILHTWNISIAYKQHYYQLKSKIKEKTYNEIKSSR